MYCCLEGTIDKSPLCTISTFASCVEETKNRHRPPSDRATSSRPSGDTIRLNDWTVLLFTVCTTTNNDRCGVTICQFHDNALVCGDCGIYHEGEVLSLITQ